MHDEQTVPRSNTDLWTGLGGGGLCRVRQGPILSSVPKGDI